MQLATVEVKVVLFERNNGQEEFKQSNYDDDATRRDRFWNFLRASSVGGYPDLREKDTRQLELMLEQKFGIELHSFLVSHFLNAYSKEYSESRSKRNISKYAGDSHDEREYARLLPKVLFKVRIRRYSSLVFGVDISGIEALAKLFDGCYDSFELFLNQYIPEAFQATYSAWEGSAEYNIQPDSKVRDAFSLVYQESKPRKATTSMAMQRANWMWIIANTSLVLPAIFALLGAFLLTASIDKQQEKLDQRLTRVLEWEKERQNSIASTYNDLVMRYRQLLDKPSVK